MTYEQAKQLRRTMHNPWLTLAIDRITGGGLTWMNEFTLTVMEYVGHDGVSTCPKCGRKSFWYRSTVGTHVCTECHALINRNGDVV